MFLSVMGGIVFVPQNVAAASSKSAASNVFQPIALSKVKLNNNSYLEVNDVQFYNVSQDKYIYYTVTVHNNGNSSLNLMDYWFSIRSNTGEKYSVQLMGLTDKKDNLISAKSTKTFKIYTKVNPKLNLFNLSLQVIKWDFTVPGFERSLGSVQIPKTYSNATPIGKDRVLKTGQNKLVTTASALQLVDVGSTTEGMVSLYIKNESNNTIQLDNYKFYLRTNTNRYYALESDRTSLSVQPGEKIKLNLYAKVPTSSEKVSYQLFVEEESGTETKQKTPVAYYNLMLRDKKNTITAVNKSTTLTMDGQPVSTKISQLMVDTNDAYHNVTLTYTMQNNGKAAVKAPKLTFELLTNNNVSYPVQSESIEGELLPGIDQEITITASIPVDKSISSLKLLVKRAADEGKYNNYLLAQYQVPSPTEVSTGNNTTYVNKNGTYQVAINGLERLPWDSQDIINAEITVKNTGNKTQPMPTIAANLWLGGVKIDPKNVHLLNVSDAISLDPGETAKMIVSSKVPNQAKFNEAKIQLSEVINEKPANTIGHFQIAAKDALQPTYEENGAVYYLVQQPGVKARITALETNTFEKNNGSLVQVLLSYHNVGNRYAKLPNIQAYFVSQSGIAVPAKVTLSDKELAADGANMIAITADVPQSLKASDLKLVIGQGIAEGKYVQGTTKSDSYINAAVLGLPEEKIQIKTLFETLELRPFSFWFNKINARTNNADQVQLEFQYTMNSQNPFEEILIERKLAFEIEYNGKKFSKVYKLGTGNDSLATGEKINESFIIDDYAMRGIANSGFKLNVYEEVDGARKLLLSHRVDNFGAM